MKKTELTDAALLEAVGEMEKGLVDADLTGDLPTRGRLFKKRVALPGRGKSGSVRALVATNLGSLWFFTLGFEKKDKDTLTPDELTALRELADFLLGQNPEQLAESITARELEEIPHAR